MTDNLDIISKIKDLKKQGKVIAFTNGCFDLLHKGHIHLLLQSKKICDHLIVGLNSDMSIKKIKGDNRPIENEEKRFKNLVSLGCVDDIIIFSETTPLNVIKDIVPDILIKGRDYKKEEIVGSNVVMKNGGKVILIDLIPNISTTQLIKEFDS
jgi:rfaE bifunctional protein nucleotidyltransferase chain/domain